MYFRISVKLEIYPSFKSAPKSFDIRISYKQQHTHEVILNKPNHNTQKVRLYCGNSRYFRPTYLSKGWMLYENPMRGGRG